MWKSVGHKPVSVKNWVAYSMFAAIILVFVLWGVHPERWEATTGGVAAVVNDETISIAEFRQQAENAEQNLRGRLDQFPPAMRQQYLKDVRRNTLDKLIFSELMYQSGRKKGLSAVDDEIRDYILEIPFLNENGRFVRERYEGLLSNLRVTPDEFEGQIRRQLVAQKLQELLMNSMQPSTLELERMNQLRQNKLAIRYAVFSKDDLENKGLVSAGDVSKFMATPEAKQQIEAYYNENKIQFSSPETVEARHILIGVNEKRTEAEAQKVVKDLLGKLTVANFASMAMAYSDDPGSKVKGGKLEAFTRGRMVPAFDKAAFSQEPGKIGPPVKSEFGYHIILVEKKTPENTKSLEQARDEIARKLVARTQASKIVGELNAQLKSGQGGALESRLSQAGIKFQDSGEFDLSTSIIPKLGENRALVGALTGNSGKAGWLPKVVESGDQYYVANITSWKQGVPSNKPPEAFRKELSYRKSSELLEAWVKEVQTKASIIRNDRILQ